MLSTFDPTGVPGFMASLVTRDSPAPQSHTFYEQELQTIAKEGAPTVAANGVMILTEAARRNGDCRPGAMLGSLENLEAATSIPRRSLQ